MRRAPLLLLFLLASCFASRAKESALLPVMRLAWPSVSANVSDGIADALVHAPLAVEDAAKLNAARDAFAEGLKTQDAFVKVAPTWHGPIENLPGLRLFAIQGVDANVTKGDISPGVAVSFKERLTQFTAAVDKFTLEVR